MRITLRRLGESVDIMFQTTNAHGTIRSTAKKIKDNGGQHMLEAHINKFLADEYKTK